MRHIPIRLIILLVVAILVIGFVCGCGTTKEIEKQVFVKDSTAEAQRDSLAAVIVAKDAMHAKELKEAKETGVVFDSEPCPPTINIDSACNRDSMVKAIRDLQGVIKNQSNKIKINADGSIEAEGKIKAAYANAVKALKEVDRLIEINAQITQENAQLKTKVNTSTESKTKSKKTRFPWWLLVIGFVLGCITWNYAGGPVRELYRRIRNR